MLTFKSVLSRMLFIFPKNSLTNRTCEFYRCRSIPLLSTSKVSAGGPSVGSHVSGRASSSIPSPFKIQPESSFVKSERMGSFVVTMSHPLSYKPHKGGLPKLGMRNTWHHQVKYTQELALAPHSKEEEEIYPRKRQAGHRLQT